MKKLNEKGLFGVKSYEVVERPFHYGEPTEDNPIRKIVRVEFDNGRVYHSYWDNSEHSMLYSNLHGDEIPMKEREVEYFVVERLCDVFLNPEKNKA